MKRLIVTRTLLALASAVPLAATAHHAAAQSPGPSPYVGFWESLDPLDGSRLSWSIASDGKGGFTIIGASTYFTRCADANGKGVLAIDGALEDGVLIGHNPKITCADGQTAEWEANEFRYDPDTGLMTVTLVGYDRPPFTLYRISPQP